MAKTNANTARATSNESAATLTLSQWRRHLTTAAKAEVSAAGKMLKAVMEARGAFDVRGKKQADEVREAAKAAFKSAGMDDRSVAKRVSETMKVLQAPDIPGDAPGNLQHLARFLLDIEKGRDPRAKGKRSPQQPKGPDATQKGKQKAMGKADIVQALKGSIEGLRKRAADDEARALLDSLDSILTDPDH